MSRTQRVLARRWRPVLLVCVLVALTGAVVAIWARIDHEASRAATLAAEADRRGAAVTTLADDVRTLRAQLQAEGEKPKAPDPSRAVHGLNDRAEVPVPIPGPRGEPGRPGRDAPTPSPAEPGTDGKDGQDGAPGPPGPAVTGPPGADGKDGRDGQDGAPGPRGERGPPGPSCPDGYSLQPPPYDPDALMCRRDDAPAPEPQGDRRPLASAVVDRKRW